MNILYRLVASVCFGCVVASFFFEIALPHAETMNSIHEVVNHTQGMAIWSATFMMIILHLFRKDRPFIGG